MSFGAQWCSLLITWAGCSSYVSCLVYFRSCCSLIVIAVDPSVGGVGPQSVWVRTNQDYNIWAAVQGLNPRQWNSPSRVWGLPRPPFGWAAYGANQVMVSCLKTAAECVGSGATWQGLSTGQYQTLAITGSGQPVRSYRVIRGWQLLLVGACGRGQAMYLGQLLLVPGLGSAKGTRYLKICHHLLLPFRPSLWNSLGQQTGCMRQILNPGRVDWCLPG